MKRKSDVGDPDFESAMKAVENHQFTEYDRSDAGIILTVMRCLKRRGWRKRGKVLRNAWVIKEEPSVLFSKRWDKSMIPVEVVEVKQ